MNKTLFVKWGDEYIDNRGKEISQWQETSLKLPRFTTENPAKAFVGWNGLALFDENVNVLSLVIAYVKNYQHYAEACGRCAPGRWGGQILYDTLMKIARKEGTPSDISELRSLSQNMQLTAKCEIGRTVPTSVLILLDYFQDVYEPLVNQTSSFTSPINEFKYITKITAPCIDACPAHVDIPAYIEGVRDIHLNDSLQSTRKTMPLAHVCGRVCPHPCEDACRRANLDTPISIMELKRIGADFEYEHVKNEFIHPYIPKEKIDKKVAIIGAGPAGLSGAYYLGLEGIQCDVYEELPVLGGEVAVGVPQYRMPIERYNKDIEAVKSLGTTFITKTRVDSSMMKEFEHRYDAILIATGTRLSKKIRAKNENPSMQGYWGAIDFLDQVNLYVKYGIGEAIDLTGKTIVCVGGGFTSMDVVRCAIRANAKKVIMLYRRDEKTIINNTSYEEYHEAIEEGVEFIFHTAIDEIVDNGERITHVIVDRYEMQPDPQGGRPQLVKIEGKSFSIECDYLIPAVSQDADLSLLPSEWNIALTNWGTIKTDGMTYQTSKEGVFAAGDCEYGPMTIVNAVGQAKRATSVMVNYLKTGKVERSETEILEDNLRTLKVYDKNEKIRGWSSGLPRQISRKLEPLERKYNNKEVNYGLSRSQAIQEAMRCMRCYYISMVAI